MELQGEYRKVEGFDRYRVYDDGTIWSEYSKRIVPQQTINSGYKLVHLRKNRKRKAMTVHRFVAMAWIPNVENKPEVNHKDKDKINNHPSNLEWATRLENARHAFKDGISETFRLSASQRMRELGKKYGAQNGQRLRELNILISKPIIAYDLEGNFVAEYKSIKEARRQTGADNINKCLRGIQKQSKGFIWRLKSEQSAA